MPRPFTAKVITASDLRTGAVIYLTATDQWTGDLTRAEVITDEAHAQLRLLDANRQSARVVGAYLAEVAPDPAGPIPVHLREALRRDGPSPRINSEAPRHV